MSSGGGIDPGMSLLGQDSLSSTQDEGASSEPASAEDSSSVPAVAGLYGSQYQLQIDVSRLPRLESSWSTDPDAAARAAPVEIRSVSYYLVGGASAAPGGTMPSSAALLPAGAAGTAGGLVRRELNRASALYAANAGTTLDATRYERVLAPEVVLLEFRYYDGTGWVTQWDSSTQGGLPVAVEIVLGLVRPGSLTADGALPSVGISLEADEIRFYRRVVYLPNAAVRDTSAGAASAGDGSAGEGSAGATSTGSSEAAP